jgi:hypothetical protein
LNRTFSLIEVVVLVLMIFLALLWVVAFAVWLVG